MVVIVDAKRDIGDLLVHIKAKDIEEFFSKEEIDFMREINRNPEEEMKIEFSLAFNEQWVEKILKNCKIFSKYGNEIPDAKTLEDTIKLDGEFRFYVLSTKPEYFLDTLKRKV